MVLLSKGRPQIIAEGYDGSFRIFGIKNGVDVTVNTASGADMNEFNGYTLTLASKEDNLAFFVPKHWLAVWHRQDSTFKRTKKRSNALKRERCRLNCLHLFYCLKREVLRSRWFCYLFNSDFEMIPKLKSIVFIASALFSNVFVMLLEKFKDLSFRFSKLTL